MIDCSQIKTNSKYLVIYLSQTEKKEVWLPCKDQQQMARVLYNLKKNNIEAQAYWKNKKQYLPKNEIDYLIETYKKALEQPRWWQRNKVDTNREMFFEKI